MGHLFVLHRETGEPLFPVEERPVPASDVPGEKAWPTQPFPTKPPPLVRQRLDPDDVWAPSEAHARACRERLSELRNEGIFTPPSLKGTVVYPFTAGGANWSGSSFDPERGILVVPVNDKAHVVKLNKLPDANVDDEDARPLDGGLLRGLFWLLRPHGTGLRFHAHPLWGRTLLQVDEQPCNAPPWGSLVAVDLSAGAIRWSMPTGAADGVEGLNNFGPALVTGGGLVFHAGTTELSMRAHDVETGEVLARFELPAGLHGGPITYKLTPDGPQYLVIAPGGHVGLGSKLGDHVIAYTLPPGDAEPDAAAADGAGRREGAP
jgi:quinoprotein glucose dehydrogenase